MNKLRYEIRDYEYTFRVYATNTYNDNLKTFVKTSSGHELVADEPIECGGEGLGPNPIELFLASIASCFIISTRIHAHRYGIKIDKIEALAEGVFDIRGFLGLEEYDKGFKKIVLNVYIESGELCDDVNNVIKKALSGWIVGSTLMRTGILEIKTDIRCRKL